MRKLFPVLLTAAAVAAVYLIKKSKAQDAEYKEAEPQEEPIPTPPYPGFENYRTMEDMRILEETISEEAEQKAEEPREEEGRKLLNLQVDLVMSNYPDDRIFLLQHHILYDDTDKLLVLMKELREQDYIIVDGDDGITVEKVILQKDNEIKDDILRMADRVRFDHGIYKGFNVIPQ